MNTAIKFDLHKHTKAIKGKDSGDGRNIPEGKEKELIDKLIQENIKVFSITNHNEFDEEQYERLCTIADEKITIFPGVEIDVKKEDCQNSIYGFNLIVSNENISNLKDFLEKNNTVLKKNEGIELEELLEFCNNNPSILLYPFGKGNKKSTKIVSEDEEKRLNDLQEKNKNFLPIKETANERSFRISNSNNLKSVFGSDNLKWCDIRPDLPEVVIVAPDIKFEVFLKKLKEEKTLKNNTPEISDVHLSVKNQNQKLILPVQPGITVIVGSRGSGKTFLLNEIKRQLEGKYPNIDSFGVMEISSFENLDSFNGFLENIIKNELNNQENSQLKIDVEVNEIIGALRGVQKINYSEIQENFNKLLAYEKDKDNPNYKNITSYTVRDFSSKLDELEKGRTRWKEILNTLEQEYKAIEDFSFVDLNSKKSLKNSISLIRNDFHNYILKLQKETWISSMTEKLKKKQKDRINSNKGLRPKSDSLMFFDYYKSRNDLRRKIKVLLETKTIETNPAFVGNISQGRNRLLVKKTSFLLTESNKKNFPNYYKKNTKENNLSLVKEIFENFQKFIKTNAKDSFLHSQRVKNLENTESVKSLLSNKEKSLKAENFVDYEIRTYLENDYSEYVPSSGESQFLMLTKYLSEDKKIYIIDEPELSLDNKVVKEVVLEKIKSLSLTNEKYIFLVTHNANLAVLSNPKTIIYKEKEKTYIGDGIDNLLFNYLNYEDREYWNLIALDLLEGGKEAFDKREEYYKENEGGTINHGR